MENPNRKLFNVLAYIGILWLVPLLAAKDDESCRFNANQGLVLFISEIAVNIVNIIMSILLDLIGIGIISLLWSIIVWAASVALFVFAIIGVVNAFKGEDKELPIIGSIKILK